MSRCRVSSALIARRAIKYPSSAQGASSGLIWGSMGWSKLVNDRSDGVSRVAVIAVRSAWLGAVNASREGQAADEHPAADETS